MAHSETVADAHGSFGGYIIGFVLSVILTALSFGLVLSGAMAPATTMIIIAVLAFVQIIVHMVFFLHLNASSGQGWNVLALAYTALAGAFLVFGTVWVMHNVSMNMMSR
jgi:cytochrome o ubiquinol oxidase operon protein cyoD